MKTDNCRNDCTLTYILYFLDITIYKVELISSLERKQWTHSVQLCLTIFQANKTAWISPTTRLCDIMTSDNYGIGCTLNSTTFLDNQIEKIE